jgi:ABC-type Fe3+-hydroxamate transport system substrate-binding protein
MPLLTSTDQLGDEIVLTAPPRRIISLVPSQTELLADLSLNNEVVGITRFCVHPHPWLKSKTVIGGTKQFNFDVIDSLNPDLIIGNKEENYQEGIAILKKKYPVWMSDIVTLEDALVMINSIGKLTARSLESERIVKSICQSFTDLPEYNGQRVLYLIWRKPWMAAGSATFIATLIDRLGFRNAVSDPRYPALTNHAIANLHPDYVFLSSEPYPFREKHRHELQQLLPNAKILLVDGEMFSWYGSRLIKFPEYAKTMSLSWGK